MKNATPATLPFARKLEGFSNPNLVAAYRVTFRTAASNKLLGKPHKPTEELLSRISAELKRRNITL